MGPKTSGWYILGNCSTPILTSNNWRGHFGKNSWQGCPNMSMYVHIWFHVGKALQIRLFNSTPKYTPLILFWDRKALKIYLQDYPLSHICTLCILPDCHTTIKCWRYWIWRWTHIFGKMRKGSKHCSDTRKEVLGPQGPKDFKNLVAPFLYDQGF